MVELEHFWWEQRDDGAYEVNVSRLLFQNTLTECVIAELFHECDKDGVRVPRDMLIERWKAEVLNIRQFPKRLIARAAYHQWFNKKGDTRDTYPDRWKAAWDLAHHLFGVDIDLAWQHLTDPEAYSQRMREESRKMFGKT